MLIREAKLGPTYKQKSKIDAALWQSISLYNTVLMKCFISLSSGPLISVYDLISEFSGHGKKSGLNQDSIAECCKTVHKAVSRWIFPDESGKYAGKPKKKSLHRKVTTLQFGMASRINLPKDKHVGIPGIGKIRCSKTDFPTGKIKGGRLLKRASGYYFQWIIDAEQTQIISASVPPAAFGFR